MTNSQKTGSLWKHYLGASETKPARDFFEEAVSSTMAVKAEQLWTYSDHIPCGTELSGGDDAIHSIKALTAANPVYIWQKSESEAVSLVKYIHTQMSPIDSGTDSSFIIRDADGNAVRNIIPFNFYEDLYNYTLSTSAGEKIYFGVGDWVLDTASGVLTFYGDVPDGVSHSTPPVITCYQYIGGSGFRLDSVGYDGAVIPVTDITVKAGTAVVSGDSLVSAVNTVVNRIESGFLGTYGWDGSDTNEGVAPSLEKIVPLTYTKTKDNVKGYDDSSNAEIGTLLSCLNAAIDTSVSGYTDPPFSIIYCSPCLGSAARTINITNGTAKLGSGAAVSVSSKCGVVKLADADNEFIVIDITGGISDASWSFTASAGAPSVLFLYWNSDEKSYLPFVTSREDTYDFGIAVVVKSGKFPPSILLGSYSLGGYTDTITPDYYGPRVYSITVADSDGNDVKSADYVASDVSGHCLNSIIDTIGSTYSASSAGFTGTIYLRSGTYYLDGDIDLSGFGSVVILGENRLSTVIKSSGYSIKYDDTASSRTRTVLGFRDITVSGGISIVSGSTAVIVNSVSSASVSLSCGSGGTAVISDSVTESLSLSGSGSDSMQNGQYAVSVIHSTIASLSAGLKCCCFEGNVISTLSADKADFCSFESNTVASVSSLSAKSHVLENEILGASQEVLAGGLIQTENSMPVYTSVSTKRFMRLVSPFYYDSAANTLSLSLDPEVLTIDSIGRITTCIPASRIITNPADYVKIDGSTAPASATNLQSLLKDIYLNKANLDTGGKVPIAELPDSVAYGGLLYIGTWTFDSSEHNGAFPKYTDIPTLSSDTASDSFQKGWFVVVGTSAAGGTDNPVKEQVSVSQTYTKDSAETTVAPITFTAGDWCIWNGYYFEKLDRAYQDAAYAILSAYCPDGLSWSWENSGHGFLDFSDKTISKAFDLLNIELNRMAVKRPAAVSAVSLEDTSGHEMAFCRAVSNGTAGAAKQAYVCSGSSTVITLGTQLSGEPWQRLIYFDSRANFNLVLDGTVIDTVSVSASDTSAKTSAAGFITVTAPADPYADCQQGSGYWKGVTASVNYAVAPGTHTIGLSVSDIKSASGAETSADIDYAGHTDKSVLVVKPYDTSVCSLTDIVATNMDQQTAAAKAGAVSGILNISSAFTYQFSFTVAKVCGDMLPASDSKFITLSTSIDGTEYPVPYTLSRNSDDTSLYNAKVLSASVSIDPAAHLLESVAFYINIYNITGAKTTLPLLTAYQRTDPTSETERIRAGDALYPDYNEHTSGSCGYKWYGTSSISGTCELLKIGAYEDSAIVSRYKWPEGKYATGGITSVPAYVDYTSVVSGCESGGSVWRFAAFSQFSGAAVSLDSASGFTLSILGGKNLEMNSLTRSTKNMIIQVKVLGGVDSTTGDEVNSTEWIDGNSPFTGFGSPGNSQGDAGMYAGSSTASVKRITFGRTPRTGKLIVRIGIAKDSGISFTGLSVSGII